jgi:hypothetical protein
VQEWNKELLEEFKPAVFNLGYAKTSYGYVTKLNSLALVRERIIPTDRPPLANEVSANYLGIEGQSVFGTL